jgi:Ca-activated chloride channel family protein
MKQAQPAGRSSEVEALVVEIRAMWDEVTLEVRQLRAPGGFWLSDGSCRRSPCDFVVPGQEFPDGRVPLVVAAAAGLVDLVIPKSAGCSLAWLDGEAIDLSPEQRAQASSAVDDDGSSSFAGLMLVALAEPAGACRVRLPRGMVATVRLGRLAFRVSVSCAEARIGARRFGKGLRAAAWAGGLSLLLHAGFGLASCAAPRAMDDPDELSPERRLLIQYYLDQAEEHALEEQERELLPQARADEREGGTGARAKGEDGSMGSPRSAFGSGARYGVSGASNAADAHIARSAALREAAEFGMVGLLNSGAGGNPSAPVAPWGRDDALGVTAGGLGLSGLGQGGGGTRARGDGASLVGHRYGAGGLGAGPHGSLGGPGLIGAHDAQDDRNAQARGGDAPGAGDGNDARTAIDPNGRFSTTYRPGRGHLAAFEAAVARGVVPIAARELVSDVGARYTPILPEPKDRALGYAVDLERTALPPGGGPVHLRISLRSTAERLSVRPRVAVHLALDVSGSMQGEPLARAKEAAQHLVERLAPTDEFSLITFSNEAEITVPSGAVGIRRTAIQQAIARANDGGGTNIAQALGVAYQQAKVREADSDAVPVVMLLSDGQPTVGERDPRVLSEAALDAFQSGIQTSTFGLGAQYDGVLMSSLASDGAGGYYYLRDADQIAAAFRSELEQRLDPAASAVEIRVRLDRDVSLLRVYGSSRLGEAAAAHERVKEVAADAQAAARHGIKRDRSEDAKGGMRFFIPAFARDDSYSLLIKVAVPAGTSARSLGVVELKYKDLRTRRNAAEESTIRAGFAASDADSAQSADGSVMRTIQGHLAGEDLMAASRLIAAGESSRAAAVLGERESILRTAATALTEPDFLTDATRFSRLLSHVQGGALGAEPYALAMVLETAARSHLQ